MWPLQHGGDILEARRYPEVYLHREGCEVSNYSLFFTKHSSISHHIPFVIFGFIRNVMSIGPPITPTAHPSPPESGTKFTIQYPSRTIAAVPSKGLKPPCKATLTNAHWQSARTWEANDLPDQRKRDMNTLACPQAVHTSESLWAGYVYIFSLDDQILDCLFLNRVQLILKSCTLPENSQSNSPSSFTRHGVNNNDFENLIGLFEGRNNALGLAAARRGPNVLRPGRPSGCAGDWVLHSIFLVRLLGEIWNWSPLGIEELNFAKRGIIGVVWMRGNSCAGR